MFKTFFWRYVTVFRWFGQCMSGARALEDEDCCGRIATAITVPEIVSRVEPLVKKDPKFTIS